MSKEINLEEILEKYNWKELRFGKTAMKKAMIEFGKQLLELAAKKARCDAPFGVDVSHIINKQSILEIINQIE